METFQRVFTVDVRSILDGNQDVECDEWRLPGTPLRIHLGLMRTANDNFNLLMQARTAEEGVTYYAWLRPVVSLQRRGTGETFDYLGNFNDTLVVVGDFLQGYFPARDVGSLTTRDDFINSPYRSGTQLRMRVELYCRLRGTHPSMAFSQNPIMVPNGYNAIPTVAIRANGNTEPYYVAEEMVRRSTLLDNLLDNAQNAPFIQLPTAGPPHLAWHQFASFLLVLHCPSYARYYSRERLYRFMREARYFLCDRVMNACRAVTRCVYHPHYELLQVAEAVNDFDWLMDLINSINVEQAELVLGQNFPSSIHPLTPRTLERLRQRLEDLRQRHRNIYEAI